MESNTSTPWTKTPLGEVTEEIRDRVSSPDGDGMSVYGVERQDDFMITAKYSATDLSRYKKIKPGDFSYNPMRLNIGSIGMCGFHQEPGLISPDYIGFRCIDSKLYPAFLRHVIKSSEWINWTESAGVGSVRQRIYYKEIANLVLTIPQFEEQKAIAKALDSIDVLIDLNTRTNATLEEMSRTLFRSWFVDFDPVHAKAEGRHAEGMDEETAALFPSEFVESEQGMIPKGWEVRSLDKIAEFLNGLALQKYPPREDSTDLPVIKIAQLRKGDTEGSDKANCDVPSAYVIQDGDVLFSWSGSLEVAVWCGGQGALNQHLFKVTSTEFPKWFYLNWVQYHLPEFQSIAASKATTMGHIQRHHLADAKVIVPGSAVMKVADGMIAPIIDQIIQNNLEAKQLRELRDGLLSKLISGEVRLPEDMIAEFEVSA